MRKTRLSSTCYEKDLYPELGGTGGLSAFRQDCFDAAQDLHARGEISRRSLLKFAAMLGAAPIVMAADKLHAAQPDKVVLVNWGGVSIDAYRKAYGEPFTAATGVALEIDGTGPLPSRVRAMAESGQMIWDVIDFDASKAVVLEEQKLLQPIDYTIVDRNKVYPGWAYNSGVAAYIYSCVLAYDSSQFDKAPNSWADFWDVDTFPGLRGVRSTPEGQIEMCMMAAGRSIKDVYPVDLDLAISKIKEIKDSVVAWDSGAMSQDILRSGEVSMANVWHSRIMLLDRETDGRLTWTWNQGLMNVDVWSVPVNNPAGTEAAMKFIASTQDPAAQAELFTIIGNGPVNPEAAALIPDDLKRSDPTQPEHQEVQAVLNAEWWNEPSGRGDKNNDTLARELWLDALAS